MARLSIEGGGKKFVKHRSSTFGSKSHGLRTDPRPLNDKMYQSKCVETLITYLSTHGYDHEISQKMLLAPMTKDFVNVVHFLMKQVMYFYQSFSERFPCFQCLVLFFVSWHLEVGKECPAEFLQSNY